MIVFIVIAMLIAGPVLAHGDAQWIRDGDFQDENGISCCGPEDCSTIPRAQVRFVGHGYFVRGRLFERSRVPPSIDGNFWLCVNTQTGAPRCLFAPRVGM